MSTIIQCCPVCGNSLSYKNTFCMYCRYSKHLSRKKRKELQSLFEKGEVAYIPVDTYNSLKSREYYENLSIKKFNSKDHWKEIFIEQELSKNPLFDYKKYQNTIKRKQEIKDMDAYERTHPNKANSYLNGNIPHCPTCNSTDIKKISDLRKGAHALAWGLFSKTARSQFECKNCGMKF